MTSADPISGIDTTYLRALLEERAARRIEALKLYEPTPIQFKFHQSVAMERIIRGGNRAGKTLAACCEVARAVTGQDPFEKWPKKDGVFYIVGKDGKELGQVLWKKLGRAGPFQMIRDLETKLWRAYRPYDAADLARENEKKDAPPLIPPRMIREIAWESRKEGVPKIVKLVNGWEIFFFSSEAKPPRGADVSGALFDEEIVDREWYAEISARLVDRSGRFIWSATPQAGSEQLYDLSQKAEMQLEKLARERTVEEFHVRMDDNPHLTHAQKQLFISKLSEDERLVRVGGEFAMLTSIIYPDYSATLHEVDPFEIPPTWTRYCAIDPGRQICAVLFMAIPPPQHGDYAYLYDELYMPNASAKVFGEKMAVKCAHQKLRAFIIDYQEGRKHETGSGRTIERQYSDALKANKVLSELNGYGFAHGDPDLKAGIEAVRSWLIPRSDGTPKIRVLRHKCPNFVAEIKKYRYKRMKTNQGMITTDDPETRGRVHQMANLRYLVQYNPRYYAPESRREPSALVKAFRKMKERERAMKGAFVNLGPGD